MVVITPRFTLLAALSSIAAVSALPAPADGAAVHVRYQDSEANSSPSRHSTHAHSFAHTASTGSPQTSGSPDDSQKSQRHPKPIIPLPPAMADAAARAAHLSPAHIGTKESGDEKKKSKHDNEKRLFFDPWSRVLQLDDILIGASVRNQRDTMAASLHPLLDRRHRHDHEKVIVKGDHDHVNVHRSLLASHVAGRVPEYVVQVSGNVLPRAPHDKVVISGQNDHVHLHDGGQEGHDKIIIKGSNDHVHAHRSPHDHHNGVIVKGNDDHVHVHRSPSSEPHHDLHEKVIVKGDHQHVDVPRSPEPEHHRHGHDHEKVIVKGDHDHVNVHRSERHHHDHGDEVVVKGDHDHVDVHRRTEPYPATYVSGDHGDSYVVAHTRRDLQIQGVPGSIDIMSQVANSTTGQKIASLVLSPVDNSTTSSSDNSTIASFVLNASGTDQTQMFLVTTSSDPSNSTIASNSTESNSTTSDSANAPLVIKVRLQVPVFEAEDAVMKDYCATFDPNPPAPAPLTVEMCMNDTQDAQHKSQVFAYEPDTGVIRPMWFNGQDDGMGDSDPGDSDNPSSEPSGSSNSTVAANSTSVAPTDPTTPASDEMASITSLDEDFGDATRPPFRAAFAKTFDASTFAQARNVTLVFSPAAPEVVPQKNVDSGSGSDSPLVSASASAASSTAADTSTASAIGTEMGSSASSVPTSTFASTASDSSASVFASSALPSGAKFVSVSATTTSSNMSYATSSATTVASLAVEVYDPAATSSLSSASSASDNSSTVSTASSSSTNSVGAEDFMAASTAVVSNSTVSESSAASTMTPVSTAPYEWMFREGTVRPDRA